MKLRNIGMGNKTTIKQVRPGIYEAILTGIKDEVDGYDADCAFQVTYDVYVAENKKITHSEIFINDLDNPRTAAFEAWVREIGLNLANPAGLVGLKLRLTFLRQVKNGGVFTNITKREVV